MERCAAGRVHGDFPVERDLFFKQRTPPEGAGTVYVVAKQWMWKLQHEEGQREINQLHIPVGKDVKLIMTSQDVIHSFYVPAFRIKQDVLPGRYTTAWFRATKAGTYHLFCAEYCGTQHSGMVGSVVVMEPAEYQAWLSGGGATQSLAQTGEAMFQQLGCSTCHRTDTQGRGPNLTGLYGKKVMLAMGVLWWQMRITFANRFLFPAQRLSADFSRSCRCFRGW